MSTKWRITVPGSTANLGPGFDSVGLGLSLYLSLTVTLADEWKFTHKGPHVPTDTTVENHLIYKIANEVAEKFGHQLPACHVEMTSELPLARGLGSSAAAIVGAIELADAVCGLKLSIQDKLNISSQIEGHPDNATASVLGGLTVSAMGENGVVDTIHIPALGASFVVYIPQVELKTAEARSVLPSQFDRGYAVRASASANMLAAALMIKDYERIGRYMEQDLWHEPFRAKLIPAYNAIREAAKQAGAYGTALSGAGPTLISLIPDELAAQFLSLMKKTFPEHTILLTKAAPAGVTTQVFY
ncbi:homoserine kinase [Lysinibacillus odysseyi]|uniref:Homoserine kinase n=1 Tax=Lysinibacillus odysseyi 34hs-1 = NBRC 100172 TaxID=1220589 RepID=A0A0A3IMX9_9BACI|nr:homoserine kinase [Lysinibacillus odysseyi]KGR86106.1 serine kinase [Lysinibacillus odysseyi 34hs-1 = NBRC 100172]